MKRRGGFTLVELLVVVAIIGLLIAILVPSLGRVRKRAKAVVCSTNERGLVNTYRMYVQENKAILASTGHGALGAWDFQLLAKSQNVQINGQPITPDQYYSKNGLGTTQDKIRFCPETASEKRGNPSPQIGSSTLAWDCRFGPGGGSTGSYALNNWLYTQSSLTGPGANNGADLLPSYFYPLLRLKNEAVVPVFVDSIWHDVLPREGDTQSYSVQTPEGSNGRGDRSMGDLTIDRHQRAVNVAFWDGRVESVKLPGLWALKWHDNWYDRPPPNIKYGK